MITMAKFISLEVGLAIIGVLALGGGAWVDVKEDITANTITIEKNEYLQQERYESLKDDLKEIKKLLSEKK